MLTTNLGVDYNSLLIFLKIWKFWKGNVGEKNKKFS